MDIEQLKTENTQLRIELISTRQALIMAQGRLLELEYASLDSEAEKLKSLLPKQEEAVEETTTKNKH